jgi:hypothetical protein
MKTLFSRATASLVIAFALGMTAMPHSANALSYDDCVKRLTDLFYHQGATWSDAEDKAKKRCSYYTAPKKEKGSASNSFSAD